MGRKRIRKSRKIRLCGCFVQSDGLREMEEAIMAMLTFAQDVNIPWALR